LAKDIFSWTSSPAEKISEGFILKPMWVDGAVRPEPLGRRETGYNLYVGTKKFRYNVGLLYEKLHDYPAYTGIMVQFPMNNITKHMGKVAFDYDRSPEGFAMQLPLASGTIGDIRRKARDGKKSGGVKTPVSLT
jgi:hypothetical protein